MTRVGWGRALHMTDVKRISVSASAVYFRIFLLFIFLNMCKSPVHTNSDNFEKRIFAPKTNEMFSVHSIVFVSFSKITPSTLIRRNLKTIHCLGPRIVGHPLVIRSRAKFESSDSHVVEFWVKQTIYRLKYCPNLPESRGSTMKKAIQRKRQKIKANLWRFGRVKLY